MKHLIALTMIATGILFVTGCAELKGKIGMGAAPAQETGTVPAQEAKTTPAADVGNVLPFDVTIGGQKAAIVSAGAVYATIAQPVAADAAIEVGVPADMVIINVFACDAAGTVATGAKPAVIIINKGEKGALNTTMDKKALAAGTYIANVVANESTSRVMFEVK